MDGKRPLLIGPGSADDQALFDYVREAARNPNISSNELLRLAAELRSLGHTAIEAVVIQEARRRAALIQEARRRAI